MCLAGMKVPFTKMRPAMRGIGDHGMSQELEGLCGVFTRRCLGSTQCWIWISGEGQAGAGLKVVSADSGRRSRVRRGPLARPPDTNIPEKSRRQGGGGN